jgi:hypothetical protein
LGDTGVEGDNIKMDLKEIGYETVDWINLAQDRFQWRCSMKYGEFLD